MKYLGVAIKKNSIGLIETDKGEKFVPFCKCNLGDHFYMDDDRRIVVGGAPKKTDIDVLRARCDELGIKYASNTSAKKLQEMIETAEASIEDEEEEKAEEGDDSNE